MKPHADELDPKFHFLLSAPEADSQGNPAVIRFSRKSREQYVASEAKDKATGWSAHYRNGGWEVRERPRTKRPRAARATTPDALSQVA